VHPLYLHSWL